ncbi:MAG: type II toxin-antitoxin system VapB family antitoxin [Candidatus Dormibacteria bacterium]
MMPVSRTNVDISDALVAEAMRRYGLSTKRAAVDFALRRLVGDTMSRTDALGMEGSGWDADLGELRSGSVAILE